MLFCGIVAVRAESPIISDFSVSPEIFWPPNNKMAAVEVPVTCELEAPACEIVKVMDSRTEEEYVPGINTVDWADRTDSLSLSLLVTRAGDNTGREYCEYIITVECADSSVNISTAMIDVDIPIDLGKVKCLPEQQTEMII